MFILYILHGKSYVFSFSQFQCPFTWKVHALHATEMFWNKSLVSKAVLHPSEMSIWF